MLDRERGGDVGIEGPAREDVDEAAAEDLVRVDVIELVSMNWSADQPSSSSSPKRSIISGPWARMPIVSISAGTKRRMRVGIGEPRAIAVVEVDRGEHAPRRGAARGRAAGGRAVEVAMRDVRAARFLNAFTTLTGAG